MIAATILGTIRDAMIDPSSNPQVAFVLLSLAAVAVLLALVLLLLALTRPERPDGEDAETDEDAGEGRSPSGETPAPEEYEYPDLVPQDVVSRTGPAEERAGSAAARSGRRRVGAGWIALLVVLAVTSAGLVATSTDRYCTGACHAHRVAVAAHARDPHADVACVGCHEDPSVAGALGAPFSRTGHALRALSSDIGSRMAPVSSSACVGCHAGIRDKTVTVAALHLRVSHRAPLAAGMSCGDCHAGTGHDSGAPVPPGMSTCTPCHDGSRASASCPTCHSQDPTRARRPSDAARAYAPVLLAPMTDCGACHDQTSCDECHGIRLPHTAEFESWSHARAASFDGRTVCLRCHTTSDCTRCHPGMAAGATPAHPADWLTSHRSQPGDSACDCHWNRLPDAGSARGSYCLVCH